LAKAEIPKIEAWSTDWERIMNILIIEDEKNLANLLTTMLSWFVSREQITWASTGEEGLVVASTDPLPDLIMLDIRLPGIQGGEVLEQLKNSSKTANIPIITMTAFSFSEAEMLAAGASAHIAKAGKYFDSPDLIWQMIMKVCGKVK
jgi:CheY-like chemotaxis protein